MYSYVLCDITYFYTLWNISDILGVFMLGNIPSEFMAYYIHNSKLNFRPSQGRR